MLLNLTTIAFGAPPFADLGSWIIDK